MQDRQGTIPGILAWGRGIASPPPSPCKTGTRKGQGRNTGGGQAFQDGSPLGYDPNDRGRAGPTAPTSPRPPQSIFPVPQAAPAGDTDARPYRTMEME